MLYCITILFTLSEVRGTLGPQEIGVVFIISTLLGLGAYMAYSNKWAYLLALASYYLVALVSQLSGPIRGMVIMVTLVMLLLSVIQSEFLRREYNNRASSARTTGVIIQ